nr:hypothetical protein CFP56_43598 [Quercus suber]
MLWGYYVKCHQDYGNQGLRLLVLGGINSDLGFGDAESIEVRDEDEAVEFGDDEWLRGKGLEIENGVRVGGFD